MQVSDYSVVQKSVQNLLRTESVEPFGRPSREVRMVFKTAGLFREMVLELSARCNESQSGMLTNAKSVFFCKYDFLVLNVDHRWSYTDICTTMYHNQTL